MEIIKKITEDCLETVFFPACYVLCQNLFINCGVIFL